MNQQFYVSSGAVEDQLHHLMEKIYLQDGKKSPYLTTDRKEVINPQSVTYVKIANKQTSWNEKKLFTPLTKLQQNNGFSIPSMVITPEIQYVPITNHISFRRTLLPGTKLGILSHIST